MKRDLSILVLVMAMVTVFSAFTVFATETVTNAQMLDMCSRTCTYIDSNGTIPQIIYTDTSHTNYTTAAEFYYMMSRWLRWYTNNNNTPPATVSIIRDTLGPSNPSGVETGTIQLADILAKGVSNANFIDTNSQLPNYSTVGSTQYSTKAMFWVFARTINWYEDHGSMPTYATVRAVNPPASWSSGNSSVTADFAVDNGVGYPLVFGAAINSMPYPTDVQSLADVGVTLNRSDCYLQEVLPNTTLSNYKNNVNNVQDPSTWNWTNYGWVDTYHNVGIKIMLIMSYNKTWLAYDGTAQGVPKDWGVYQDVVKKIYLHFQGKIDYVEIWNEPDLSFLSLTNSGYSDKLSAYKDIYYYASSAIRSVDANIPIGGPALADHNGTNWAHTLLSDSRNVNTVNFLSYHWYDFGTSSDQRIAAWQTEAAGHGKPNMPIFMTEWNYSYEYDQDPMNNGSTDAISYVGERLTKLYVQHAAGAGCFAFNKITDNHDFYAVNADGSLTPKTRTWRLLSKGLALGSGNANIKGISWSGVVTNAASAINVNGTKVVWMTNDSNNSDVVTLHFQGLTAGTQYTAQLYEASAGNDATTIKQTFNFTGNGSISFSLPAKAVVGVKIQ